jgi:3-hydroxyacyl-CoA dehydrogenase
LLFKKFNVGIAQISAANGFQVVAVESSPEALKIGMGRISGSLDKVMKKDVEKGKMTEVCLIIYLLKLFFKL